MSDYISREAIIGKVEKHYCAPCKGQGGDLNGDWCRSCVINSVLEKVRGIPAADVAPVRHGRWNRPYISWFLPLKIKNPHCFCTNCAYPMKHQKVTRFCPNCGAKMDG